MLCQSIFLTLIASCFCDNLSLRRIGSFSVPNAAFTYMYENKHAQNANEKYDLLVSTFTWNPISGGKVDMVRGIGQYMTDLSNVQIEQLANRMSWPNEIAGVPEEIFGKRMVVVPDGFLVPFKDDGNIYLIDVSGNTPKGPFKVTDHTGGKWFYHRVIWKDMDGDGDKDILTCRAREPGVSLFTSKDSELIWLENPSNHSYQSPWAQHVITHGPDIYLRNLQITTPDGTFDVIVTSEFFTKKLSVHWTTDSQNRWTDSTKIFSRTVDDTAGALFDVEVCDVNGDGSRDLLVISNGHNGTVLTYEIPRDFRTDAFPRHTLATGFVPRQIGIGRGAPGSAFCIHPRTGSSSGTKPIVLLSGDDDGRAYLLEPQVSDSTDWSVTKTAFLDVGHATVGQIAFADVDGDTFTDIFIPSYSAGKVLVYSFKPHGEAFG